jgi:hypothetical protein
MHEVSACKMQFACQRHCLYIRAVPQILTVLLHQLGDGLYRHTDGARELAKLAS